MYAIRSYYGEQDLVTPVFNIPDSVTAIGHFLERRILLEKLDNLAQLLSRFEENLVV